MSYQTDLVRRLRGQYGIGPASPNGEPEMGYRQFDRLPPIHGEAATEIERLRERVAELEASNASKHTVMLASARALAAAERDAALMRQEMKRYLPIIERAESDTETWTLLTLGTGVATANGYRHALGGEGEQS